MTSAIDGTDGIVNATALSPDGRTLYIGGQFSRVGTPTGCFVSVDATAGSALAHPVVNGSVKAQVPDGNGGWYIGGDFTKIDGRPNKAVAHVRADGTLDPSFTAPSRLLKVDALAFEGTTVYVSGNVVTTSLQTQPYFVIALDAVSGSIEKWAVALDGVVRSLSVGSDWLYMGGSFGSLPSHLAALNKTTGASVAWNPAVSLSSGAPTIDTVIVAGSSVYIAGSFDTAAGAARASIAALDASTATALSWAPQVSGRTGFPPAIHKMVLDGSNVYFGGDFASVAGQPRLCVAAVDATSANLLAWDAGLTAASGSGNPPFVSALAVNADSVFVAGSFALSSSPALVSAAAFDKATSLVRSWVDVGPAVSVACMTAVGAQVAIGGNFKLLAGERRNNIAAIDTAGGQVTGWNPDSPSTDGNVTTGVVNRLLAVGNTVYAAGQIQRIGGANRQSLAALDATTGQALSWDPQIVGHVTAIALSSSTLYVAGDTLTSAGGQARTIFAAFDLSTGQLNAWAPGAITAGSVNQLLATDGAVYAAGDFGANTGQPRSCLAAFDPNTGTLLPWSADASASTSNPSVSGIALLGSTIYVVGNFERIAGQSRPGIAAVGAGSGAVLAWPQSTAITNPRAVAAAGDRVYVATNQGGGNPPARALLAFSISSGALLADQYVLEGYVSSITIGTSNLYLGGNFTEATNALALGVANYLQ